MRNHPTEAQEQRALFSWRNLYHQAHPELELNKRMFAIPNGAWLAGRTEQERARRCVRLKQEGMLPGVWDIFLAIPAPIAPGSSEYFAGMWIEMKVGRNTLTAEQKAFHESLCEFYYFLVAHDWEFAARGICKYLGREF